MARVQTHDFDIKAEIQKLRENSDKNANSTTSLNADVGAVVSFIGIVRDFLISDIDKKGTTKTDTNKKTQSFFLEHYPGMTERVLNDIELKAQARFDIIKTCLIHRVGQFDIKDNIVFIAVSSKHRGQAFQACEFMIDVLKTQAPFWKKEGDKWVEAKKEDKDKTNTWLN